MRVNILFFVVRDVKIIYAVKKSRSERNNMAQKLAQLAARRKYPGPGTSPSATWRKAVSC
jgi:hypothetical protein